MLWEHLRCIWALWRFRGYKPQPLNYLRIRRWLKQFDHDDRIALLDLLDNVVYVSEKETQQSLVMLNQQLMKRLQDDGLRPNQVIFIQVDEAGSSSPVMLNMLKEAARLERLGCRFLDSKDVRGISDTTNSVEQGAIIYVDDFSATGHQFCRSRDFVAQYLVGTFSEFFLLPYICEEAVLELDARGIQAVSVHTHLKTERPLHSDCSLLKQSAKDRLVKIATAMDRKGGLGYRALATMVVFYRNAPNTVPLLLRGSLKQEPYCGIFPRTTDLPA